MKTASDFKSDIDGKRFASGMVSWETLQKILRYFEDKKIELTPTNASTKDIMQNALIGGGIGACVGGLGGAAGSVWATATVAAAAEAAAAAALAGEAVAAGGFVLSAATTTAAIGFWPLVLAGAILVGVASAAAAAGVTKYRITITKVDTADGTLLFNLDMVPA